MWGSLQILQKRNRDEEQNLGSREKNTLPRGKQGYSMSCQRFNAAQNFFNTFLNLKTVEVQVIDHIALWFLVWTVTVGPDSQRFPTDYTTWEPKALSGASEGRRCMCVGTWERSWISGSCPDSDTWRCPCQCELGSICSPWRPERRSAHRCSGTSLAGVSRAEWLLTKGLALLAGQAVTFCSFPAHTSCTGRAHRTPTAALASAAATGHQAQAWLGPSLLAVTCVYSQLSHPHGHPHCL